MARTYPLIVLCLAGLAGPVRADARQLETIELAIDVLDDITAIPDRGIPRKLLRNAQGIVIVPNVVKLGFVVAGRFGRGVLLTKEKDGRWSNPVFLHLAGGGVGWQAGVQSTDVVLVIQSRRSIDGILQGGKFTLGADANIAAGPFGRSAEADTDIKLQAEIYSYSRSRGLFGGVSLQGSSLKIDWEANARFYHNSDLTPRDILQRTDLPVPPAVIELKSLLENRSTLPRASEASPPPQ